MRHKFSDETFILAVQGSFSIAEVLRKLGMCGTGGAYQTFKTRAEKLGVDTSHFTGQLWNKGKTGFVSKVKLSLSDLLVEDSGRKLKSSYKKRIFEAGLLENKCSECGIADLWNGKPITLQIDHINGEHFDNRIENIRILCPNCHSQTDTFCSRNRVQYEKKPEPEFIPAPKPICICLFCKVAKTTIGAEYCLECWKTHRSEIWKLKGYHHKTKIEWPSKDELLQMLDKDSCEEVGRKLGVSGNAVKKRLKYYP